MKLFKRQDTDLAEVWIVTGDATTVSFMVPRQVAVAINGLRKVCESLNTEAAETAKATAAMRDTAKREHERQQKRIDALVDEKHRLRIQADAYTRALRLKQAEVDKTLAAFKQLDADYIEACGRLQDAEERLAGYKRVTT